MKRPQLRKPGISPAALLEGVANTAPFLFEGPPLFEKGEGLGFLKILLQARDRLPDEHDLWDYFDLCLSAHFATVGTFVPTDVDLAIRQKLWAGIQAESAFDPMWNRVLEMRDWSEEGVSTRWVRSGSGEKLSGHQGEWLSVAMGAYGCARRSNPHRMGEIRESIEAVWKLQETVLLELKAAFLEEPAVGSLRSFLAGVAAVAHNLGDLDRMFETWEIDDSDILKRRVYRSGHEDARFPKPVFLEAGRLYQMFLASENHRNFALRVPKGLRKSRSFLVPFGPFLDDWGRALVLEHGGLLRESDFREIIEALILGWKKLNPVSSFTSQGYARALAGMASGFLPEGSSEARRRNLESWVPPAIRKELQEGGLRTHLMVTQAEFERKLLTKVKTALRGTINPD
jgi:hypothetical protein